MNFSGPSSLAAERSAQTPVPGVDHLAPSPSPVAGPTLCWVWDRGWAREPIPDWAYFVGRNVDDVDLDRLAA